MVDEPLPELRAVVTQDGLTKLCRRCGKNRPASAFGLNNRDGLQSWCKACRAVYSSENRADLTQKQAQARSDEGRAERKRLTEERSALASASLKKCAKCSSARPVSEFFKSSKSQDSLRSSCKKCDAQYNSVNAEKIAAKVARCRKKNPESYRAATKRYHTKNPETARTRSTRRRAKKLGAGGSYSASDIAFLVKVQGNKCAHEWCRVSLKKKKRHVDHVMPLALGGSNGRRNLQLLCQPCNNRKHAKHPIDFAQQNGLLL